MVSPRMTVTRFESACTSIPQSTESSSAVWNARPMSRTCASSVISFSSKTTLPRFRIEARIVMMSTFWFGRIPTVVSAPVVFVRQRGAGGDLIIRSDPGLDGARTERQRPGPTREAATDAHAGSTASAASAVSGGEGGAKHRPHTTGGAGPCVRGSTAQPRLGRE